MCEGGTDYIKLKLIKEVLYWAWILKRAGVNVTFVPAYAEDNK